MRKKSKGLTLNFKKSESTWRLFILTINLLLLIISHQIIEHKGEKTWLVIYCRFKKKWTANSATDLSMRDRAK